MDPRDPPTQTPPLQTQPIQTVPKTNEVIRDQDKVMLVLAYLAPLSLIPLLTVKDSPYVKWHAANGLALGIVMFGVNFILGLTGIFGIFICLLAPVLIVLDLIAMIKALKGERWRIPGVSDM